MSKSDKDTGEFFYEIAKRSFDEAKELYGTAEEGSAKHRAMEYRAASNFWLAFVLGHPKAPYSLAVCFELEIGLQRNDYLEKLLYGVARKIGDEKYYQYVQDKITIPQQMQPDIDQLTDLFLSTQQKILQEGGGEVNDQMGVFDEAIKIPNDQESILDKINKGANPHHGGEHHQSYQADAGDQHYDHDEQVPVSGHAKDGGDCCVLL